MSQWEFPVSSLIVLVLAVAIRAPADVSAAVVPAGLSD